MDAQHHNPALLMALKLAMGVSALFVAALPVVIH
jgi:hypothetical protein